MNHAPGIAQNRLVPMPRGESILFLLLIVAHLAPIWAFDYFPSRDGPVHVFNASVIREYHGEGAAALRAYFTLNQRPDPTWFVHLLLSGLLYVFPARVAEKIVVSLCVILFPLGVRYAVRAIDREAGFLSVLAFPFVLSYFLHMGFFSFSLSLAMTFFVLGYWLKHWERLGNGWVAVLGLLTVVLYFSHIFSLLMVCIAIAVMAAWVIGMDAIRDLGAGTFGLSRLRTSFLGWGARPFVAVVPSLILAAVFLFPRKMVSMPGKPLGERMYDLVHLMSLASFDEREVWLTAALAVALAMVSCVILSSRLADWRTQRWDGFLAVTAVYLVIYFTARETELVTPGMGQGGSLIHMRLNPFPYFMLILWIAAQRYPRALKRSIQVTSVALAAGLLGLHTLHYAQLNGHLAEYLSGMERIEAGATILPLDVSTVRYDGGERVLLTRLGNVKVDPLAHASHYIAIERRAIPLDNYEANIGYFPILFRPERDPYVHMGPIERRPPAVDFLGYHRRTGGQVDYVLLLRGHRSETDDDTRRSIYRQLENGYDLVMTTSRNLVSIYRRKEWTRPIRTGAGRAPDVGEDRQDQGLQARQSPGFMTASAAQIDPARPRE